MNFQDKQGAKIKEIPVAAKADRTRTTPVHEAVTRQHTVILLATGVAGVHSGCGHLFLFIQYI